MTTSIGLFMEREPREDWLWHQCDGPGGLHGDLEFRAGDDRADRILAIGTPIPAGKRPTLSLRNHLLAGLCRDRPQRKLDACWDRCGQDPSRTTALFLEPPSVTLDLAYDVARRHAAHVYGPDPRAGEPIVVPTWWELEGGLHELRRAAPPEKSVALAAVISGKAFLPGHRARLEFLLRLRRAGVPLELFGRALPPELGGRGEAPSKVAVLGPARFALAIENFAEGELYVTEKLWDPLLAWCLPLYFGSRAADRLVPKEAFLRIPDLGEEGVRFVRDAVARPALWEERLEAIAEARRRVLGDLRLVEWYRREVVQGES